MRTTKCVRSLLLGFGFAAVLLAGCPPAAPQTREPSKTNSLPWMDGSLSPDQRADLEIAAGYVLCEKSGFSCRHRNRSSIAWTFRRARLNRSSAWWRGNVCHSLPENRKLSRCR